MKGDEKIIRTWRVQLARPFGVHLWFDPSVESVRLLSVPTDFICISDTKGPIEVDKPEQKAIMGLYGSVSGQAGGAEGGDQDSLFSSREGDPSPAEPLGFQEDYDATKTFREED